MCTSCPFAKSVSIPHKAAGRGHPFGFSGGPMADVGAMKKLPSCFGRPGLSSDLRRREETISLHHSIHTMFWAMACLRWVFMPKGRPAQACREAGRCPGVRGLLARIISVNEPFLQYSTVPAVRMGPPSRQAPARYLRPFPTPYLHWPICRIKPCFSKHSPPNTSFMSLLGVME